MRVLILIIASAFGSFAAAKCIEVTDYDVNESTEEYGLTDVQWRVAVENQCDVPYDAFLSIEFVSAQGDSLHKALAPVIVKAGGGTEVTEQIRVPTRDLGESTRIRVDVKEERERPL